MFESVLKDKLKTLQENSSEKLSVRGTLKLQERKLLIDAWRENTSVTVLSLDLMMSRDVEPFFDVEKKTIKEVWLSDCLLDEETIDSLIRFMKSQNKLDDLLLDKNEMEESALQIFIDALRESPSESNLVRNLQKLTFIPDDQEDKFFIQKMAEIIVGNNTLQSLFFSVDRIDREGMTQLVEALGQNQSLTSLNLGNSKITHEAAEVLVGFIKSNQRLKNLYMGYLEEGDIPRVFKAFEGNSTWEYFRIENEKVSYVTLTAIFSSVNSRETYPDFESCFECLKGEKDKEDAFEELENKIRVRKRNNKRFREEMEKDTMESSSSQYQLGMFKRQRAGDSGVDRQKNKQTPTVRG